MSNNTVLYIGGIYNLFLVVFHLSFWRIFHWSKDLASLSYINRAVMQIFNLCLVFLFLIFAYLSFFHTEDLLHTPLGNSLLILVATFWFPVVADMHLRFLRPLKIWQHFQLETQLLGWDTRWFYFQQIFISDQKTCTVGLVKTQVRHGQKRIDTQYVLDKLNYTDSSPDLPKSVRQWINAIDNHS